MTTGFTSSHLWLTVLAVTVTSCHTLAQPGSQNTDSSLSTAESREMRERLLAEDAADNLPFETSIKSVGRLGDATNHDIGLTHIIIDGSREGIDPITCVVEEKIRFAEASAYTVIVHRPYGFDNDNMLTDEADEYIDYLTESITLTAEEIDTQVAFIEVRNLVGNPSSESGFDVPLISPWQQALANNRLNQRMPFEIDEKDFSEDIGYRMLLETHLDGKLLYTAIPGYSIFKNTETNKEFIAKDNTKELFDHAVGYGNWIRALGHAADKYFAKQAKSASGTSE